MKRRNNIQNIVSYKKAYLSFVPSTNFRLFQAQNRNQNTSVPWQTLRQHNSTKNIFFASILESAK